MSILIQGMEMPKNCKDCPFSDHEAWCLIPGDWRERYYCPDNERSEYCPLIELPPHGRLRDLDALYEEISNGNKAYNGIEEYDGKYPNIGNVDDCLDAIKYADTVIEAEGET